MKTTIPQTYWRKFHLKLYWCFSRQWYIFKNLYTRSFELSHTCVPLNIAEIFPSDQFNPPRFFITSEFMILFWPNWKWLGERAINRFEKSPKKVISILIWSHKSFLWWDELRQNSNSNLINLLKFTIWQEIKWARRCNWYQK